jgi:type I restriction enzyme S subunit
MKTETLGALCNIVMGRTPSRDQQLYWGKGNKWVSISDLKEKIILNTKEEITDLAVVNARCRLIPKGTLLFSFKLTIGKMAFTGCDLYTNEAIVGLSIIDNKILYNEYLYYALRVIKFEGFNQAAKGKTLNSKSLAEIKIPLPPFEDQIRIATLLSKVENLISRRREQLKQLDELLKSVFLEMFGDPVRNEKGWERVTIRNLISEAKYGTSKSAEGGQYKYLRMNNISTNGFWDFTSLKYIDIDDYEVSKYALVRNDLVFNRTNSKELVGKTAVYSSDEKVIIAGYLIRVRTKPEANPWYIWGYLNSKAGKLRLFNLCRNIVGMANINAQELQDIPILKPPIDLQNQFAAIVAKVEALRGRYTQSLTNMESLYGTLSKKAFKGELDLSRLSVVKESVPEA